MFYKVFRVFVVLTVGIVFTSCSGLAIDVEFDLTGPVLSDDQEDMILGEIQYSIRFDEAIRVVKPHTMEIRATKTGGAPVNSISASVDSSDATKLNIFFSASGLDVVVKDKITITIPPGYLTDEADNPNELITHSVSVVLGAASIGSFTFTRDKNPNAGLREDVIATIKETDETITVTVPSVTNRARLVATFTVPEGATVKVGGNPQTSGTTPVDFSDGNVTYTVTATDGTTKTYTVTVLNDKPDLATASLSFSYSAIIVKTTEGTAHATGTPAWTGGDIPAAIIYSITASIGENAPETDGSDSTVVIDSGTGMITLTADAKAFNSGTYTVTATAGPSSNYKDGTTTTATVTVEITTTKLALHQTSFSYNTAVEATEGVANDTGVTPVWDTTRHPPSSGSITYRITAYESTGANVDENPANGSEGNSPTVRIDATTGKITITDAAKAANSGTYTVTATAHSTSIYEDGTTTTATVTVTITKANLNTTSFSYIDDVDTVEGSPTTGGTPVWNTQHPIPLSITYSITDYSGAGNQDPAVKIDLNTGQITITDAAVAANSGTYTVTATAGPSSNYFENSTKSATVTVTINRPPGAPTGVTVNQVGVADENGKVSVTVSWTAPSDPGVVNANTTITGYTVYYQDEGSLVNGAIDTANAMTSDVSTTEMVITSLTAGTDYTFAVTAKNSNSLTSPLSDPKKFISTAISSFQFTVQDDKGNSRVIAAKISDNDITAVVPWGMSSSLSKMELSTNPSIATPVYGHPLNGDYSKDVILEVFSEHRNIHKYTVSVLEIGYKEDEVTDDAAKTVFTQGDLSHPWLFSIKNLDDTTSTAEEKTMSLKATIKVGITLDTESEKTETFTLNGPTEHPSGVNIYGAGLKGIFTPGYDIPSSATAAITVTIITEDGKEYPPMPFSLTTSKDIYSWHDLQSLDNTTSASGKTYMLACDVKFPAPGKYGFPGYGFRPLGGENGSFYGSIDGGGKTIENLYIDAEKMTLPSMSIGMIQVLDKFGIATGSSRARISNLVFKNPQIIAKDKQYSNVGVLAGMIDEAAESKNYVNNIHVENMDIKANATNIGGIAGQINGDTFSVQYVSSSGTINAGGSNVGGLVGSSNGVAVVGYSTATITGANVANAGGLVGNLGKGHTIGFSLGSVSGSIKGGLVGTSSDSQSIIEGYTTSPLSLVGGGVASGQVPTDAYFVSQDDKAKLNGAYFSFVVSIKNVLNENEVTEITTPIYEASDEFKVRQTASVGW